jgi:hypothetical protein
VPCREEPLKIIDKICILLGKTLTFYTALCAKGQGKKLLANILLKGFGLNLSHFLKILLFIGKH